MPCWTGRQHLPPKAGKFVPRYTSGHDTILLYIVTSQAADPQVCLELYSLYQSPRFPGFSKITADEVLSDTVQVLWGTDWHSTRYLRYWVIHYTLFEVLSDTVQVLWGTDLHSTRYLRYWVIQYTLFEVLSDTLQVLWGTVWHSTRYLRYWVIQYTLFEVLSDTVHVLLGAEWHGTRSLPKPYLV
jgi:hypothetical protein